MTNQYSERKYIIGGIVILLSILFIIRLLTLQMFDNKYKLSANNNSQRKVTIHPPRGLIYDRNHKLLVYNEATYDIMVIPNQLEEFDTNLLAELLNIDKKYINKNLYKAKHFSYYKPSLFLKQLSVKSYGKFQENIYKFPGFYAQPRTLRKYPQKIAAHILGYVGEVDKKIIENNKSYKQGDYIGRSGVEKYYENILRGKKGSNIFLVDVHNRIRGKYKNGKYDTLAINGNNLTLTLDAKLQAYGEKLMKNKIGSIVAIEPSTGEILTLVSSPNYDPNLLVGRQRAKNYRKLLLDSLKPLFNRAINAKYPPGSTFKLVNALIGMQEEVLNENTYYTCNHGYHFGGISVGCHGHKSPLNLKESIQISCNSYYCNVFKTLIDNKNFTSTTQSFNVWRNYVTSFGFGRYLESDISDESRGFVPKSTYYDKYYKKNHWSALTIISLAIGQGELGITPLQMANMASIMANRGYYYIPHIVKEISEGISISPKYEVKHFTKINSEYFPTVIDGMELVVNGGPGSTARIAKIDSIIVCGKTGTAQNPHGKDHSIFIAFAPKNNPKIAIAVYVENGGFGATWAAPIASLMIEKYLKNKISNNRKYLENYILNANLINKK